MACVNDYGTFTPAGGSKFCGSLADGIGLDIKGPYQTARPDQFSQQQCVVSVAAGGIDSAVAGLDELSQYKMGERNRAAQRSCLEELSLDHVGIINR
jgi:hypothetical protein